MAPRILFVCALIVAAALRLARLQDEGFGNLYYAATVRSMLEGPHTFFFASFDPEGFVTVDKPPVGFWVQTLFAMLFGYRGLSLLLPQALAGILAVALLHGIVRRAFGDWAGAIAALVLATTPISVAADRNNTVDAQLVLALVAAGWAALRYAESARAGWLLLAMGLVGVGFEIKMLQAYTVLPAFVGVAFLAARVGPRRRIADLAAGVAVLGAVSFAWPIVVDVTPIGERPYVGSSANNTVMELVLGHNGLARILPPGSLPFLRPPGPPRPAPSRVAPLPPGPGAQPPSITPPVPGGPAGETGSPGPLRLFNQQLGGQASWLLPIAFVGAFAAARGVRWSWPPTGPLQQLGFWALWLTPQLVLYSVAMLFHRYYLEMLAPGIAALVGIGVVALWRSPRLMAFGLVATALVEAAILSGYPAWASWLLPFASVLPIVGAAAALALGAGASHLREVAITAGLAALLVAPLAWAVTPVIGGADVGLPFAGPELVLRGRTPGPTRSPEADRLTRFLVGSRADERFLVATQSANEAAPIIVSTGHAAMALGGFSGGDPILTLDELASRVANGEVRFFLLTDGRASREGQWVRARCAPVPPERWRGPGVRQGQQLHDCVAAAR